MSSVQAMEDACGVEVSEPIRMLRRLLYCGEWIESHALHVYMLHAPDFLGFDGAVEMAREHPDLVQRGLGLKKTGNELMIARRRPRGASGERQGRWLLPRAVTARAARAGRPARAGTGGRPRDGSLDRRLRFPRALRRLRARRTRRAGHVSRSSTAASSPTSGLEIAASEYDENFYEEHVERSNALHSRRTGGGAYLCGPLARFALGADRLSPLALEAAHEVGLESPCRDAFRSIVVRSVELVYACDEALRLIDAYEEPDAPAAVVEPRAGVGTARPKRRAGCSTTGTRSPTTARSSTRRSSRRPPRTSPRSRRTCAASSSATTSFPTTSCSTFASRRFATSIRASRARLTFSTWRSSDLTGTVVIGVGNEYRGDDAAGREVARIVRERGTEGLEVVVCELEPSRLIDAWEGAATVFLVDAVSSGAEPGTVHRFDATSGPVPSREFRSSTHALGIGETVELARALGRLPERIVVFGIEGESFGSGRELSGPARAGVDRAVELVLEEAGGTSKR